MPVEFDSLVFHSFGWLIPRHNSANVLGVMWRFKQKRNTSGNVTRYKARWVILGNYQIHGINYSETYASFGVKEFLNTIHALAVSEDLELQSSNPLTSSKLFSWVPCTSLSTRFRFVVSRIRARTLSCWTNQSTVQSKHIITKMPP